MPPRRLRALALATALLGAGLVGAVALDATRVVGTSFPGFAVTVAGATPQLVPSWLEVRPSGIAHREVLDANGLTFQSAGEFYEYVAAAPAGTPLRYSLRSADGSISRETIPSRPISAVDYAVLFGIHLVTGFAFLLVGAAALWRNPREPASLALYSLGVTAAAFYLTGGLSGGLGTLGHLHYLASILVPASLLHLAAVFPVNRLGRRPALALAAVYAPWLLLAIAEEVLLPAIPAPSIASSLTGLFHAGALTTLLATSTWDGFSNTCPIVRRRGRIVALGSLVVLSAPVAIAAAATTLGLPLWVRSDLASAGMTTFLLPLVLAYATTEKDSFEFDLAAPRIATLVAFLTTVAAVSGLSILAPEHAPWRGSTSLESPLTLASLIAIALATFSFLRTRLRRVLAPRPAAAEYDREGALADLSDRLARAHGLTSVIGEGQALIAEIFGPLETMPFLERDGGRMWLLSSEPGKRVELCLPEAMRERLQRGDVLTRYEWENRGDLPMPRVWRDLGVDVLLPLRGAPLFGILAVSRRHSGARYADKDIRFLKAACNQLALGLTKAAMFDQMEQDAAISAALIRAQNDIATSLNSPDILNQLCEITARALELECSHTLLWDPEREAFAAASAYGDTAEHSQALGRILIPRDILGNLTERLKSEDAILSRGDQLRYHKLAKMFSYRPSSVIIMPLRREGEIIGLHLAGSRRTCPALTARHFRIARGIGHAASMALANARLMEELASASRVKSDFVASMSHELRTPLNHIIGYNDLMIDGAFGDISDEQTDTLQRIRRSSHNLLELIEATLNLSRLDTKDVGVDERDVDLPALVAELADRLEHSCKKPGVAVEWKIRDGVTTLRTDPVKVQMVLKNLVENAVKFTERGRVVIDIRRLGEGIQFEVSDTGAGIPKDLQAAIFEPFRRVHDPVASSGAGLGLHIVRRLTDLLHGTITVASEVDLGSCFRVWLPLRAAANEDGAVDPSLADAGPTDPDHRPTSPTLH